ncbi:MAG: tetratricopeptide repeat protein [Gammaproteobacteria bacterium]|nr:tetratricopeptide repeat protein [Gammaproteobacteria bacterium]
MKRILFLLIPVLMLAAVPVQAQQASIKQTETHSVFKGIFLQVWSKLKAISPQQRQSARSASTYTAGIRGEEATETLIQPYWKDDLSQDQAFQQQLESYSNAQQMLDKGDLQASSKAFADFIQQYAGSDLMPNALFGKSLSHAGLGDNEQAADSMNQFIQSYPKHPLNADARQILSQLQ